MDEGNVYEALLEGWKQGIRNVWWVVDYNRQNLDGTRIPNERGRWLLVDRAVVEVDCRWCGAVAGEPCRRYQPGERSRRRNGVPEETIPPESLRYGVAVHVRRKEDAKAKHGGGKYAVRIPPYKLRIRADELAELQSDPREFWHEPEAAPDIDVPVTPK